MARKKTDAPAAIETDRVYKVKFRLPHVRGRTRFSPVHSYTVKGSVLAEIPAEKIASAEPV